MREDEKLIFASRPLKKQPKGNQKQISKSALIPDSATAIAVARPILVKRFGKDKVVPQLPLSANYDIGFWRINGSILGLKSNSKGKKTPIEIWIDPENGRILNLLPNTG